MALSGIEAQHADDGYSRCENFTSMIVHKIFARWQQWFKT